ncbi:MAG: hypothetical protein QM675_01470 [Protaetiibacter sp.]
MVSLRTAAIEVLEENRMAGFTRPARGLYPHQWSWDSGFIAIGLRRIAPARARDELLTLLRGQWRDGRIPQIVYTAGADDRYQPGADFWGDAGRELGAAAATAGFVQPPIHGIAALLVARADPEHAPAFLERVYPALAAWHDYLSERRARDGALAEIVHPWESGTDNTPLWDAALERIPRDAATEIRRPDLQHADAGERPGRKDYERYFWIAEHYRDRGCRDDDALPFRMVDPAFNALWALSEHALARIAALLGRPVAAHEERAERIAAALDELFLDALGCYTAYDAIAGVLVERATASGLVPLVLPGLGRAERLVTTLTGPRFLDGARLVPSYDRTAADHLPGQYWRGPAWFNVNWMLATGLRDAGRGDVASGLERAMVEAAAAGDFPEYVDPVTLAPHGTRRFGWTSALVLDALAGGTSFREALA